MPVMLHRIRARLELSHRVRDTMLLSTEHTHCRVCDSDKLLPYLDLGVQPLANALRDPADTSDELRVPLAVQACLLCGLSQLTHVVDPKVLYSNNYPFYSGANPAWHTHCASLCDTLEPLDGKFVLEIGSNDGTLLAEADRRGATTLGIEPARNFTACGYPVIADFWSSAAAKRSSVRGKA